MWYKVARPAEYLAITGHGIKDIKLANKAWILPGQSCITFDISPVNYTLEVQATGADNLPFLLPAVFTIGPRFDNPESLLNHVKKLVEGIIEGETRVVAASMTMEELFKGTKEFKSELLSKVKLELDQFGFLLYHANVKQFLDVPGHEYFSYSGQKTQTVAANQAKVDDAEARMKGEVGSKPREGQTFQNAKKVDADTKICSTQRQEESRTLTEVNLIQKEWVPEVVKELITIECSYSDSCGQMETCNPIVDNGVVSW